MSPADSRGAGRRRVTSQARPLAALPGAGARPLRRSYPARDRREAATALDRAEDRRIFADTGRTGLDRAGSPTPPAHALLAPEALAGARFRQRPADFEAEVVHRGLLAQLKSSPFA